MAYLDDSVLDAALSLIDTTTENLYICDTLPTTFTQASSTYKLGTKATPSISSPTNGDASGRKITIGPITDGTCSGTGTAGYWALTDDSLTVLLAAGPLGATQEVTSGNPFSLTAFDIELPDVA